MDKGVGKAETGLFLARTLVEFGFHSVGSRSGLNPWSSGGFETIAGSEAEVIHD